MAAEFAPIATDGFILEQMLLEPENRPSFSIFLEYADGPQPFERLPDGGIAPLYGKTDFGLEITPLDGAPLLLDAFQEQLVDLNADGILGTGPEEGVELRFPVEETVFVEQLVGVPLHIDLINRTAVDLQVVEIGQRSGMIARGSTFAPDGPLIPTAVLEERTTALPQSFALEQNYPNPFNNSTVIRFALPKIQEVELSIYCLFEK